MMPTTAMPPDVEQRVDEQGHTYFFNTVRRPHDVRTTTYSQHLLPSHLYCESAYIPTKCHLYTLRMPTTCPPHHTHSPRG